MFAYLEALLLGAIQGLTEFLPISSDGHLALAELAMGRKSGGLALTVLLHLGTLVATFVLLWARIAPAVRAGFVGVLRPRTFVDTEAGRDALTVLLATIPTGVIGLVLEKLVEEETTHLATIGGGLLVTSVVLASTRFARPGDAPFPTVAGALLLGVAQGFAVLPGLSRSACTIAVLLWLRLRPARAFELSMLVSLPAVTGALLLETRKLLKDPALAATLDAPAVAFGVIVSLLVGLLALRLLRGVVVRGAFPWFAAYTAPLGVAVIVWGALAR